VGTNDGTKKATQVFRCFSTSAEELLKSARSDVRAGHPGDSPNTPQ